MSRSCVRWLIAGLNLLLFALLFSLTHAVPAFADDPVSDVHIFHTREWFAQNKLNVPVAANLQYYGGHVMHTATNYAIYWAPGSRTIPKGYRNLIKRYFRDIGGTTFYNIVTQYYENPGPVYIQNSATWGGAWIDKTNPYPHAGNFSNPLTDADIRGEVKRAIAANHWPTGFGAQYFVFTPRGITSCLTAGVCTPGTANPAYCAYHGHFVTKKQDVLYANMPYANSWGGSCGGIAKSPNNNVDADIEVSVTSHEQFEAVTDAIPPPAGPQPPVTAWTDPQGYEIGDKCAYTYGAVAADGSNLNLNGHPYIVQLEWSNAVTGCAKQY